MIDTIWTRDYYAEEIDHKIRIWNNGDGEEVRISEAAATSDFNVVVEGPDGHRSFDRLCSAVEHCVDEYGIIPEGSVWRDTNTGNMIFVEFTNTEALPEDHDAYRENEEFTWVYCEDPDAPSVDYSHVTRETFYSEMLELVSPGVF